MAHIPRLVSARTTRHRHDFPANELLSKLQRTRLPLRIPLVSRSRPLLIRFCSHSKQENPVNLCRVGFAFSGFAYSVAPALIAAPERALGSNPPMYNFRRVGGGYSVYPSTGVREAGVAGLSITEDSIGNLSSCLNSSDMRGTRLPFTLRGHRPRRLYPTE